MSGMTIGQVSKYIIITFSALFAFFLLKEIVKYLMSTWMVFCVYYTISDLYKKRKVVTNYVKLLQSLGYIPEFKPARKTKISCVK